MISLDVLAIGNLERDEEGNITSANSTSIMIRTGDRIIVVDTSSKYMLPALKTSMKQLMVLPKDVDTVVLTHSHSDHIGNLDFFPKAKVLMHSGEKGNVPRAQIIDEDMEIAEGVRLVHTPGHTNGSMSVFVDGDIKYVIAGDALPRKNNYVEGTPPSVHYDKKLAMDSINKVVKYADMVVPGHDSPFMTKR